MSTTELPKPPPMLPHCVTPINSGGIRQPKPPLLARTAANVLKSSDSDTTTQSETKPEIDAPDQSPSLPDQSPSLPEQSPSLPEQSPSLPEQRPSLPEQSHSLPEQSPSPPEQSNSPPEQSPSPSEQSPSLPEQSPSLPEQSPSPPEQSPSPPKQSPSPPCMDDIDDKASVNGNFGWMTLDSANIPCLFRGDEKYVSVRMVEQKLLSKYPSTYPEELRKRAPLVSQFITDAEAKLLNEINVEHCACEFGQLAFTSKDLVVSWNDFVEFYKIVKKHFPNELPNKKVKAPPLATGGGWVQLNNTVVPYVRRMAPSGKETLRLAPLPVIKYAANLLANVTVPSVQPKEEECKTLTDMCKTAGLDFTFASDNTPLVLLTMLPVYSDIPVKIKRLPDNDPFSSAEYRAGLAAEDAKNASSVTGAMQLTTQHTSGSKFRTPRGHSLADMDKIPPPNVTIQKSATISVASGVQSGGTMVQMPLGNIQLVPRMPNAGPPAKRPRLAATIPAARPVTIAPAPAPPAVAPGTVVRPATAPGVPGTPLIQVPINFVMPPPGMVHGAQGIWRPRPDNPADMKKLADMMNMQAAILSQSGTLAARTRLMQPSPLNTANKTIGQSVSSSVPQPVNSTAKPVVKPSAGRTVIKNDPSIKIRPITFHNKKVSCLVKEGSKQQFALVEAVSRVYFPQCNLEEFLHVVTQVLQIAVYQLNRDEENGFIRFYGLPTKTLKCNKVLNLKDLDDHMAQITYMFTKKAQTGSIPTESKPLAYHGTQPVKHNAVDVAAESSAVIMKSPQALYPSVQTEDLQVLKSDSPSGASTDTTPRTESNNNSINNNIINNTSVNGLLPTNKPQTATKSRFGGLSKLSKLEDAVNRLHKNKLKELDNEPVKDEVETTPYPENISREPSPINPPMIPRIPIGTTMTTEL